jgi:hypothetical protein
VKRGQVCWLFALVLVALVAFSACGSTSGSTSAATATIAATATPAGCAAIPGFAHATTASGGTHFGDVGFPSGSVGYTSDAPEANGFQYRLIHVCVAGSSAAAVASFHATDLAAHGWMTTATYPATGDLATACPASTACFIKNDGVIRFAGVGAAATASGVTTYTAQLVIQPYSFGGALLMAGDTEDFDPTGPGGGTNDVTWTGAQLAPAGGAQLVNKGTIGSLNALAYADLAAATFSTTPIPSATLVPGDGVALRTGDGHVVKLRVTNHSGTDLTIEFVAYAYTF